MNIQFPIQDLTENNTIFYIKYDENKVGFRVEKIDIIPLDLSLEEVYTIIHNKLNTLDVLKYKSIITSEKEAAIDIAKTSKRGMGNATHIEEFTFIGYIGNNKYDSGIIIAKNKNGYTPWFSDNWKDYWRKF